MTPIPGIVAALLTLPPPQVAWFKDGVRTGVAWEFRAGGGAVVGAVDLGGALSGRVPMSHFIWELYTLTSFE